MPDKVTKIPARSFFVITNARSDWPYNSQCVTLVYWDGFNKDLQQLSKVVTSWLSIMIKTLVFQKESIGKA